MSQNSNLKKIIRSARHPGKKFKSGVVMVILAVFISTLFIFLYKPRASAQIYLTSGTTWTVPSDWSNTNNTIEAIGGGGGGGGGFQLAAQTGGNGGGGGGAGGYSEITDATLTPGITVTIAVGGAGSGGGSGVSGTGGGDTYLCNSTSGCSGVGDSSVIVGAHGGGLGTAGTSLAAGSGGAGGAAGTGSLTHTGGTGSGAGVITASTGGGGGGAGGAGGPNANGNNAATATSSSGSAGGQGDGTSGGAAGAASGGTGGNGTEYDSTHGSGGGGGGGDGAKAAAGNPGGNGGTYGAGGGGGGGNGKSNAAGGSGGNGQQGLIRITYNRVTQTDYRWRLDDGSETTGTSLASQDAQASITYPTNLRLRFVITNAGETTSYNYTLEYSPYANGCYSWAAVPVTATTQPFNMYNTSNYSNGTSSTNVTSGPGVISDPSGFSFAAGQLLSTANSATITLSGSQFTEIEYSIQPNSNATSSQYCFRVTNAGTPLDSYNNYALLSINYPPSAPTIYSVQNGSTNVPRAPIFQLRSNDLNSDYLKYVVEVCSVNIFPCTFGAITYNESSACWSGQDAQSGTAYNSQPAETGSTMAYCQLQTGDLLAPNTTYYWRAKAIDPGGSNTYSPYSSVASFTTGSLEIQIGGGTCTVSCPAIKITGGTKIGN